LEWITTQNPERPAGFKARSESIDLWDVHKRQTPSLGGYANPSKVQIIAEWHDAMIPDHPYRCALASRQRDANVVNAFVDMIQ